MPIMKPDESKMCVLPAQKIDQLESEFEANRSEIEQLREGVMRGEDVDDNSSTFEEPDDDPEYLHRSLGELVLLRERRLGVSRSEKNEVERKSNTLYDDIPGIIYTTSSDSDETRNPPTSPRVTNIILEQLSQPTLSSEREIESPPKPRALGDKLYDERDHKIESLEAVIDADTVIIKRMKDTLEKMVSQKAKAGPNEAVLTDSDILSQAGQNQALKEECERLQGLVTTLESHSSTQENVIEFLKAQMVNLLVSKHMMEDELESELDERDITLTTLKRSFNEEAGESSRLVTALGARNSLLEDEIERLKAENVKLQIRTRMMEEEKRMAEEAMETELQLFYIEKSRHEIL